MIEVLMVEDQVLIRKGIKRLLEADGRVRVMAEASSAEEALEKASEGCFHLVTTDLVLPERDGLWLMRRLREAGDMPVLAVTMHDEAAMVARAFEAGATGYILKSASIEELLQAIGRVSAGERYLQPGLVRSEAEGHIAPLSLAELEVLHFSRKGLPADAVRCRLSMSVPSFASRVRSICRKLEVKDLASAVERALRERLLVGDAHGRR